jgi:hypothetical protein
MKERTELHYGPSIRGFWMQQQKKLKEGEACSGSSEGEKVWWGSSILGEGGKEYKRIMNLL